MNAITRAVALAALCTLCILAVGCNTEDAVAPTQEAPLLAPQNVTVSQNAFGDVIVMWDPNSHPRLRGYNVYRLDSAASAIERLTVDPIVETRYVDERATSGREYQYRVTSVGTDSNESAFSEATIDVDPPKRGGKPFPDGS